MTQPLARWLIPRVKGHEELVKILCLYGEMVDALDLESSIY